MALDSDLQKTVAASSDPQGTPEQLSASHADDTLRQLCDKAIWLKNGTLMEFGEINEVLAEAAPGSNGR